MILATDIVYIAGPMTGLPDVNRPAFHAAAAELVARFGCTVLNPAEHPDGLSYCEYMELAMEKLKRANTVLLLPDFWLSKGASFEFEAAGRDGKTFYVISKDMRIWPFHICKEIGR